MRHLVTAVSAYSRRIYHGEQPELVLWEGDRAPEHRGSNGQHGFLRTRWIESNWNPTIVRHICTRRPAKRLEVEKISQGQCCTEEEDIPWMEWQARLNINIRPSVHDQLDLSLQKFRGTLNRCIHARLCQKWKINADFE